MALNGHGSSFDGFEHRSVQSRPEWEQAGIMGEPFGRCAPGSSYFVGLWACSGKSASFLHDQDPSRTSAGISCCNSEAGFSQSTHSLEPIRCRLSRRCQRGIMIVLGLGNRTGCRSVRRSKVCVVHEHNGDAVTAKVAPPFRLARSPEF